MSLPACTIRLAALSAQTGYGHGSGARDGRSCRRSARSYGATGQFMPDPSDTGFFTLSESEMVQQDRQDRKPGQGPSSPSPHGSQSLRRAASAHFDRSGRSWLCLHARLWLPSQESVVTDLFQAAGDGDTAKAESYLASSLSEDAKSMIISSIPQGATVSVEGMDQSMTETAAKVKASLSKGGEQEYTVKFVRSDNHIGWAVSSLDMDFSAADNQ